MAQIYNDTKKADLMSFGKSFARLNGQPLDESAIWSTYEKAAAYAKTAGAYVGQIIAVLGENKVSFYGIQDAAGTLKEVGSKPIGDNKGIIIKDDGTVTVKGLEGATVGYIAKKAADGSIEWVKESGYDDAGIKKGIKTLQESDASQNGRLDTLESSNATVIGNISDLQSKVQSIEGVNTTQGERITALEGKDKTFEANISALQEKDNAQDLITQDQGTRLTTVESAYVKSVDYVAKTGVFTFTLQDGTTKEVDLAIEKVVTNFEYDTTKEALVLTLADGTTQEIPMTSFIQTYTGSTGTEIKVDVSKDNEISASLINSSITAGKIAANAVTTDKILDNNVTAAKLADSINTDIAKGVDAQTRVGTAEGKITANESAIEQLQTDIGTKASDSEFQAVKTAVNNATTGLATKASQSSVDTLGESVTAIEGRLDGLDTKTDTTNSTLSALKNKVEDKKTGLDTKASQQALETLVNTVNEHGKTLGSKADQSSLDTLVDRVSVNETAITGIKEKDNAQDGLIASLRTDVDTKQTAAQVNDLISKANINVNKLTQTADEILIINGGQAAEK